MKPSLELLIIVLIQLAFFLFVVWNGNLAQRELDKCRASITHGASGNW